MSVNKQLYDTQKDKILMLGLLGAPGEVVIVRRASLGNGVSLGRDFLPWNGWAWNGWRRDGEADVWGDPGHIRWDLEEWIEEKVAHDDPVVGLAAKVFSNTSLTCTDMCPSSKYAMDSSVSWPLQKKNEKKESLRRQSLCFQHVLFYKILFSKHSFTYSWTAQVDAQTSWKRWKLQRPICPWPWCASAS
jgi:hypothetical protein